MKGINSTAFIGNYKAMVYDTNLQEIKVSNQPLEYYQNLTIKVFITYTKTNYTTVANIPILDMYEAVKQDNDLYYLKSSNDVNLTYALFKYLKTNNIPIIVKPIVQMDYYKLPNDCPTYYLSSPLLDDNIIITTNDNEYTITHYEQLQWLFNKGFII